jgi:undecaprenol kinase/diacylglycerol kinase (ATP)
MINKFRVAFRGLLSAFQDKSILLQFFLGLITFIGFYIVKISYIEWLIVVLLIGLVISMEIINTCIERLCDLYDKSYNKKIKYIKDLSSAAVLFSCIIAAFVALLILINKFGG